MLCWVVFLTAASRVKLEVNSVKTVREMNETRFRQLVVGEKFRLPGSDVLVIKETLRQESGLGWVNATYDITGLERPYHVHDDTQVVRRRSNEGTELKRTRLKTEFGEMR